MPKTPDEIKKGLECCNGDDEDIRCDGCPYAGEYDCVSNVTGDALALIQQLEAERDAAVKDIPRRCKYCVRNSTQYLKDGRMDDVCLTCFLNNHCNWQWRGAQKEGLM